MYTICFCESLVYSSHPRTVTLKTALPELSEPLPSRINFIHLIGLYLHILPVTLHTIIEVNGPHDDSWYLVVCYLSSTMRVQVARRAGMAQSPGHTS